MPQRKIAFIVNPISGCKSKEQVLSYISSHSAFASDELLIYKTKCAGDAIEAAKRFAAEGYHLVVAIGGDGTVNEVAQGLMGSSTVMGIVPMGSGNGLARDLLLPMNVRKAVDVLTQGKEIAIDGGKINGQPFFCTSGVGYDALIGNRFAKAKKRGFWSYTKISAKEIFGYKPQRYRIIVDGKELNRTAFLITIANASQWGNNVRIAPEADMCDGIFDVVIVSPFPLYAIPSLGIRLLSRGMHHSKYVNVVKCRNVVIEREEEGFIHFDGEPGYMGKRLEFTMVPKTLKVIMGIRK